MKTKNEESLDVVEKFIAKIWLEMVQRRISRYELARRLGWQPTRVYKAISDAPNMTAATMAQIAEALNMALEVRLTPKMESRDPVHVPDDVTTTTKDRQTRLFKEKDLAPEAPPPVKVSVRKKRSLLPWADAFRKERRIPRDEIDARQLEIEEAFRRTKLEISGVHLNPFDERLKKHS